MNNQALETARILLNTKAVKLNVQHPFTFASGIKSPIYCDNRYLLGFPEERDKIIDYFCSLEPIQNTEVIVGTATAGIAWAAIIADRLKKPTAYVRAEKKQHGAGKTIEGADVAQKKVFIIEDLISTGKSSKKVLDNLAEQQASVQGIAAIFTYEFPESRIIFGDIPLFTLSDFSSLLFVAESENFLNQQEIQTAKYWNLSPSTWQNID